MGVLVSTLLDRFGSLQYDNVNLENLTVTVGQLKQHLRVNKDHIRRYAPQDARTDIYTQARFLHLETGRIVLEEPRQYMRWVFFPEEVIAALFSIGDVLDELQLKQLVLDSSDPSAPGDQGNEAALFAYRNPNGDPDSPAQVASETLLDSPIEDIRVLDDDASGYYAVDLNAGDTAGFYVAVLYADRQLERLDIFSNESSTRNTVQIPVIDPIYQGMEVTMIYESDLSTFLYIGPIYQIRSGRRSFRELSFADPAAYASFVNGLFQEQLHQAKLGREYQRRLAARQARAAGGGGGAGYQGEDEEGEEGEEGEEDDTAILEPADLAENTEFRIPIEDSARSSAAVLAVLDREGDQVDTYGFRLANEFMNVVLGYIKPSDTDVQKMNTARVGYRGELFYSDRVTTLAHLPPLLPDAELESVAGVLQRGPDVGTLHLDVRTHPGGVVRLAWYRGREPAPDQFLGYDPVPSPVILEERVALVNGTLEANGGVARSAYPPTPAEGYTYSLWAFVFTDNAAVIQDVTLYTRRCVQRVRITHAAILAAARVPLETLQAGRSGDRTATLPLRADRPLLTEAYSPAAFSGYQSILDWSGTIEKQRGSITREAPVSAEEAAGVPGARGGDAVIVRPERFYNAKTRTYRDGLFRATARVAPAIQLTPTAEAALIARGFALQQRTGGQQPPLWALEEDERLRVPANLPLNDEEVAVDISAPIRFLRQLTLTNAVRQLSARNTEYRVPERLRALLLALRNEDDVAPSTYIATEPGFAYYQDLLGDIREQGDAGFQRAFMLSQNTILPITMSNTGAPGTAIFKFLRDMDRAISLELSRVVALQANPFYMPYLLRMTRVQMLFAPADLIDSAVYEWLQTRLRPQALVGTDRNAALQGLAQLEAARVLHRFVQWRNRFHRRSPYPPWLRRTGLPLVHKVYQFHMVEWTARDARTGAVYNPARPPRWGSLVWFRHTYEDHPLVDHLRQLWAASNSVHSFVYTAGQELQRYRRQAVAPAGHLVEHLAHHLENVALLLHAIAEWYADELADAPHKLQKMEHFLRSRVLADAKTGAPAEPRAAALWQSHIRHLAGDQILGLSQAEIVQLYVACLSVTQVELVARVVDFSLDCGGGDRLGEYLNAFLLHPRVLHTPGYWMGDYRSTARGVALVNTVETLLPEIRLITTISEEFYPAVRYRLLQDPLPRGDVFVPVYE